VCEGNAANIFPNISPRLPPPAELNGTAPETVLNELEELREKLKIETRYSSGPPAL